MRINYLILAGALSGCIKDDSSGTNGINPNPKSDIENKESIKHISGGGVIHSGVIVKVSFHDSLCQDMARLAAMNGLDGLVPRWFPISPSDPISAFCRQRVVIMDSVEDRDSGEVISPDIQLSYLRMHELIIAVKRFHQKELIHNDLHLGNIRKVRVY
jgi:hypothetical protein